MNSEGQFDRTGGQFDSGEGKFNRSETPFETEADDEEARRLFDVAGRHKAEYPLFAAIYHVLKMAPSSRRYERDEMASEAFDALDHLTTDGHWHDWKETGETRLEWDGQELTVYEDNGGDWQFRESYAVEGPGDIYD